MNKYLDARLEAILAQLKAVHSGGSEMTSATKGAEREAFVDLLLRGCLPAPFRFGSGEVTDAHETLSAQVDIVIENPFFPSFPLLGTAQHRLYLIQGVAMAIEVKSDKRQFSDAVASMRAYEKLNPTAEWPLSESTHHGIVMGASGSGVPTTWPDSLGFAIVIYNGWEKADTFEKQCADANVSVALQLSPTIFYARNFRRTGEKAIEEGTAALFAFLCVVNDELNSIRAWNQNVFRQFMKRNKPGVGADA